MDKKVIGIVTSSRADYGLLRGVIAKLSQNEMCSIKIIVTGTHLIRDFGNTYQEIENDGITIHKKIEILMNSDSRASITKSMGIALFEFSSYFENTKIDLLLVLGDRFETLAICIAAVNQKIPIAHLFGGEITEGSLDEIYRHAITKMSNLHFTSTEEHRNRVIQLGENPEQVFSVGAMGVENALLTKTVSKKKLGSILGFDLMQPYAVVTYHASSDELEESMHINNLLAALKTIKNLNYIFTKANADAGGKMINNMIFDFIKQNSERAILIDSMGTVNYLSALKNCQMVIGNSSSGLVEAPTFGIPTVNIGDRQKGRTRGASIIDCDESINSIIESIEYARTYKMKRKIKSAINPYGKGNTSNQIVDILVKKLSSGDLIIKKAFYDLK